MLDLFRILGFMLGLFLISQTYASDIQEEDIWEVEGDEITYWSEENNQYEVIEVDNDETIDYGLSTHYEGIDPETGDYMEIEVENTK